MGNRKDYIAGYFGIALRHTVVPLNTKLSDSELLFIIDNANIETIISDSDSISSLAQIRRSREIDVIDVEDVWLSDSELAYQAIDQGGGDLVFLSGDPIGHMEGGLSTEEDIVAIYYTSGTTGRPKGAALSHRSATISATQFAESYGVDSCEVRHLTTAPLFHIQMHGFVVPVLGSGGLVVIRRFSPEEVAACINEESINVIFAVPTMFRLILDHPGMKGIDKSNIRLLQYGASIMPSAWLAEIREFFPNAELIQGYGQTETTGVVSVTLAEETMRYPGSTGRPVSGTTIKIFDDSGKEIPTNTIGEIVARGPQIMRGYIDNREGTEQALRDGWLHTGDLGYVDENGLLYVVGRKRDMIIRGGQNIYPKEVEDVILRYPGISQCAVVGVPHEIYQEAPVAVVTLNHDLVVPALGQLREFCINHLAEYKTPTELYIFKALPQTASGKIQKHLILAELKAIRSSPVLAKR
jgi:long-chain acyl-CoA synthetase